MNLFDPDRFPMSYAFLCRLIECGLLLFILLILVELLTITLKKLSFYNTGIGIKNSKVMMFYLIF